MMNRFYLLCFCSLLSTLIGSSILTANEYRGKKTDWFGFACYTDTFEGCQTKLVVPQKAAPGSPWVFRATYFGHEPQTEIALLKKGWHVAFIQTPDMHGTPNNIRLRLAFCDMLHNVYGLSERPFLLGMSLGGLNSLRFATEHPDRLCGHYLDNPVSSFYYLSVPSKSNPEIEKIWKSILTHYGKSERELIDGPNNPIVGCRVLAERKIPLLIICGDADQTVVFAQNGKLLAETYKKLGGQVKLIVKPGEGHHPHSLKDPKVIVDFALGCIKP